MTHAVLANPDPDLNPTRRTLTPGSRPGLVDELTAWGNPYSRSRPVRVLLGFMTAKIRGFRHTALALLPGTFCRPDQALTNINQINQYGDYSDRGSAFRVSAVTSKHFSLFSSSQGLTAVSSRSALPFQSYGSSQISRPPSGLCLRHRPLPLLSSPSRCLLAGPRSKFR